MQDTAKTLEIYREAMYPTLAAQRINSIVEDNASPHNNDKIRESHRDHQVTRLTSSPHIPTSFPSPPIMFSHHPPHQ